MARLLRNGEVFIGDGGMTRKLWGWQKADKFYLSAFMKPRAHDAARPAVSFESRESLDAEVNRRSAELVWEGINAET